MKTIWKVAISAAAGSIVAGMFAEDVNKTLKLEAEDTTYKSAVKAGLAAGTAAAVYKFAF